MLNLTLPDSYLQFLNDYQSYGFESQESMIKSALEKLKQDLEVEKDLDESAKLYAEIYQEDLDLQELTEAACADFIE